MTETDGEENKETPKFLGKYRDAFLAVVLVIAAFIYFSQRQEQEDNRETLPKEMIGGNKEMAKLNANPKFQELHKIGAFAEDSPNSLAFGKEAKSKALDLEINPTPELDGITRKGLCDLRRKMV